MINEATDKGSDASDIGFDIQQLLALFYEKFGNTDHPPLAYFAPGRVNLIGDHTDYTGGFVFPCGTDTGSLLLIRRTSDKHYRLASTNFELVMQLNQEQIDQPHNDHWINYPLGVIDQFRQGGFDINGLDCLLSGNVPNGAGLSSSASIEVVTAFAINALFDCNLTLIDLIKMAQAAENEFVGMQCGIMDQFAVAMAQDKHAMLLNCNNLQHRQVPLSLQGNSIVLANTNQRRELNDSAYNQRVAECSRALELIAQHVDVIELGQVRLADLQQHEAIFKDDPVAFARARHVVSENARVNAAVPALEKGDIMAFGKLMNESHESLKTDFAVSSEPLDTLAGIARTQKGVLGSRLTGAGFGGCTVNIVQENLVEEFKSVVGQQYKEQTGLSADFYLINPGAGVRQITL